MILFHTVTQLKQHLSLSFLCKTKLATAKGCVKYEKLWQISYCPGTLRYRNEEEKTSISGASLQVYILIQ